MTNSNRPFTTLFMLASVDGKISTGDDDSLDFDRDLPLLDGVSEGLDQYYALEKLTDLTSLNTGRVMAKIGVNRKDFPEKPMPVSFVIIDNQPHLTERGVEYLSRWCSRLYLVTSNGDHPAFQSKLSNLTVLLHEEKVNFKLLFERLRVDFGIEAVTVQSGGNLNAELIRLGLIDHISIVVAPVIIGGRTTSTLVDGEALHSLEELHLLKPLKLIEARALENSYLLLRYDVS